MQFLPEKDKELLKELGVKSFDDFNSLLMLAGIDPAKAFKHASESHSFDEYMTKDIYIDNKNENDYDSYSFLPRVLFHKRNNVNEYHIRIKLKNAPVNIWRELKVPSNISLELLAAFLIDAIGWDNCHLHQFVKNDTFFMSEDDLEDSYGTWGRGRFWKVDANNYSLDDVLKEKGDRMRFEYDFGDGWMHEIWVKGIRDYEPGEHQVVKLIKGHGACPPEDCGGVGGYEELLSIREKKRKSAEDRERLEWYLMDDEDFDPEFCDLEYLVEDVDSLWLEVEDYLSTKKKNPKSKK